jgi:hypothetical protein
MKIYYFSKNSILGAVIVFVMLCGFLGVSLLYFNNTGIASNTRQPVYQGNSGKKAIALTVNVDWGEEYIPAMLKEFKKHK